jgi:hypothetical protein
LRSVVSEEDEIEESLQGETSVALKKEERIGLGMGVEEAVRGDMRMERPGRREREHGVREVGVREDLSLLMIPIYYHFHSRSSSHGRAAAPKREKLL